MRDNRAMRDDAATPTRPSADDYFLRATSAERGPSPAEAPKPSRTFTKRADYMPRSFMELMVGFALMVGFILPLAGFALNWAVAKLGETSPALVALAAFAAVAVGATVLRHWVDKAFAPKPAKAQKAQ